jgi:uncharacterized protein with HEPN domain
MSARDIRAYLHDIIGACDGVRLVLADSHLDRYRTDLKTRLATERELITIGEAVGRLSQLAPEITEAWETPVRAVIGLRNVLVHGYFTVHDAEVFRIASEQAPLLREDALRALQALEDAR